MRFPIQIDRSRDALITDFGRATLANRYLLDGEGPQDLFARVASAGASNAAHAQRLYDYMSKHWFMPATPVLSNLGTTRGLPISCFVNEVADSFDGIMGTYQENGYLARFGGGIGSYWGNLRSIGERIGCNGQTSGVVPFIRVQDSMTLAVSQGSLRRGSAAVYLPVWHPEIEEFIEIRRPTGGDPNRKSLNLHHGITIPDEFMAAVENGDEWALRSPHTGEVLRKVDARSLWIRILTARLEQGEPYLIYTDTVNRMQPTAHQFTGVEVRTSNLCVAGETRVLTENGYEPIASLAGQDVRLWNGQEWSLSRVEETSPFEKLRKIEFSNGAVLYATDAHKFYVQDEYHTDEREVRAVDLVPGDKLVKWDKPVVHPETDRGFDVSAYASGFMASDGCHASPTRDVIWLYGVKRDLAPLLKRAGGRVTNPDALGRIGVWFEAGTLTCKRYVPINGSLSQKLSWLAGYLDGDGTVARNGDCETLQFVSVDTHFLNDVRLLLNTLGADCSFAKSREGGEYLLPDGRGGSAYYRCRPSFRCCITAGDTQRLLKLGLELHRLDVTQRDAQRDAHRFVTVVSNGTDFDGGPTYCANEPKRHRIVLEGILTGNCAEILQPTGAYPGEDGARTAVCCLASVNAEYWDEWSVHDTFVRDVMEFLDNVLETFINTALDCSPHFSNAVKSAIQSRSVGLGLMGFHSLLQKKAVPFESAMAESWNRKLFQHLRDTSLHASRLLADERGACPDNAAAGVPERFVHRMAVAPTASISIIAGGPSPGIDPLTANVFVQKTLSGTFRVTNPHLRALLAALDKDNDDVWLSIMQNKGSVQHLDFLTDTEKDVFKTAFELNPSWVIHHAAVRAPFICQSASTNLHLPADIHKRDLHAVHFEAWKKGVKSLYYCRSLSIQRADTVSDVAATSNEPAVAFVSEAAEDVCLSCQ